MMRHPTDDGTLAGLAMRERIGDGEQEAGMLPRVATTTGTLQPSPALPAGGSVDATARPQLSAAALANLRADVLLRLIETMLKHLPPGAEANPSRDLLETLLVALKTLPGREGENGRKLADILAKLPPELRPSVEKLISTVLSSMPTRSLIEIIRNPNGPEAQKLATLIATSLSLPDGGDFHGGGAEHPQKPLGLTLQQLAILDRQGSNPLSAIPARVLAEALRNPSGPEAQKLASLIATGLPIADEGGAEHQQKPIGLANQQLGIIGRQGNLLSAIPARVLAEILRNPSGPEAQKLAALLANVDLDQGDNSFHAAGAERKPLGLTAQQLIAIGRQGTQQAGQSGDARALQAALKSIFDADGSSKPRAVVARAAEAVAGRLDPALVNRLPAETNAAARTELHSPLPIAKHGDQQPVEAVAGAVRHGEHAEEPETATPAAKREELPAKAQSANATGQALARSVLQAVARDVPPALLMQAVAHLVENLSPEEASFLRALLERPLDAMVEPEIERAETGHPEESVQQAIETETAAEGNKAKPETSLSSPRQVTEQDEALPMPARPAAQPVTVVDVTPDRLLPTAMPRDGIPLAFVPYLPAEEDLEWSEKRNTEDDEAADEDAADSEAGGDDAAQQEADASDDEPESADMARKREKTAEMVGVIEPGLVFYQKLGDYWA
ncbi:hypothetical protein [Shinella sp.]|uniref:hypothetical protein n=2 Tax=Shinella sp. TaxID=1870904 RepID=UPI0040368E05